MAGWLHVASKLFWLYAPIFGIVDRGVELLLSLARETRIERQERRIGCVEALRKLVE